MSQVLTTPAESLKIAMPSFTCRPTDWIEARASDTGTGTIVTRPIDEVTNCQNLINPSQDDEIREEKNAREVMSWVSPIKAVMR